MATALITGGTSGIGAAFARQLAARGFDLVLVARDEKRLSESATALHASAGIQVETIAADLAKRADVARVVARIRETERPIDFLVNNAGFGLRASLLVEDIAEHEHAMDVMCRAVLALGGAAAREMKARGHGAIVNVSSIQGMLATGSYGAIKAWVIAFSQALSVELRGTGVTSTVLMPGWVRTEWHERAGSHRSSLPGWLWTEPDAVVRSTLRAVDRGRAESIPTVRYRVLAWFARHLPRRAIRRISAGISSSRTDDRSEQPGVKADNHR